MTVVSVKNVKGHLAEVELSDGKTVLIERDYAAEIGLKKGALPCGIEEILKESEYRRARSRGLWFLDRGDRTEKTLTEKIVSGGISKDAAVRAVERLKELGLVNDVRFAENYYERLKEQNVSKRAAYQKLYSKGVPSDIIKQVLSESEVDETEQIINVIEKKYLSKLSAEKGGEKVAAALMRKGFSYSSVREAMKKYKTEMDYED